jgi:hypothetical protein
MSCLDTFCVYHLEGRNDFICVLDKVDFAINGYEVDEEKYPKNPKKALPSSERDKQNIYVLKLDDDSYKDMEAEVEVVVFNDIVVNFKPGTKR